MFRKICLSLVASTALFAGAAQAANDYLLQIDGISGTSSEVGFEGYIPVGSWSLGLTRGACQAMHFVKTMDSTSPEFTAAALLGTYYAKAVLVARKAGGDGSRFTYLKLTLNNSVVMSYQTGGSEGGFFLPQEQISMQPSSVMVEAFEQDAFGVVNLVATNTVTCQKVK